MKKLIKEDDVKQAAKSGIKIKLNKDVVITPGARDLGKSLDIFITEEEARSYRAPILSPALHTWPLKNVAIASDHGGFYMKEEIKNHLRLKDYTVTDLGPANANTCDYPDYAIKAAQTVSEGKADCGIVIDSVGIGSAIAANKVNGILAAKCNNVTEAKSAREHNYANILTLGSKILGITAVLDIVDAFLNTKGGAERHQKRIVKIFSYENRRK